MQITNSQPYLTLLPLQEPARERTPAANTALPVQTQNAQEQRATRAIEDIRSAERMLNRRRTQNSYTSLAQEGRQQRAVAAYQSWQQSDERAYVSQVLGVDVYA